jgi:hypothetical protein
MNGSRVKNSVWMGAMAATLLAASYPHSVLWAQDGVGSGGTPILRSAPIPIDDDLPIIIPIERNIPPDPGVAGDATLAGIDSDKDGVRDDVEREIVRLYPKNAKARAVLYQEAKYYQVILANSASASVVSDNYGYLMGLSQCLKSATGDLAAHGSVLRPQLLNTKERSDAYLASLRAIKGMDIQPKAVACP